MKIAVLSMDIEDWYHLDYFRGKDCRRDRSLLDGVAVYREILERHGISSSFFVLGELIERMRPLLAELATAGHDLAAHGWDHTRPLTLSPDEFADDLHRCKSALEDAVGMPALGYRAPCFSLDRKRLDLVRAAGLQYDSSRILFGDHPLYGTLDMQGYSRLSPNVFREDSFFEFQVSTLALLGKNLPVSGGGYLRLFPWWLMQPLIKSYLCLGDLYVLYIHPFELSPQATPPVPAGTSRATRTRFGMGRASVPGKLSRLIQLLQASGYRFMSFASLRAELLGQVEGRGNDRQGAANDG